MVYSVLESLSVSVLQPKRWQWLCGDEEESGHEQAFVHVLSRDYPVSLRR